MMYCIFIFLILFQLTNYDVFNFSMYISRSWPYWIHWALILNPARASEININLKYKNCEFFHVLKTVTGVFKVSLYTSLAEETDLANNVLHHQNVTQSHLNTLLLLSSQIEITILQKIRKWSMLWFPFVTYYLILISYNYEYLSNG
jgi:hypothetical protein